MAYTYTRTSATFKAGEGAPDAFGAVEGTGIINEYDNMQLILDEQQPVGAIEVQLTEPPTLRLRGAVGRVASGYVSADTGEFVNYGYFAPAAAEINGNYVGTGSELEVIS